MNMKIMEEVISADILQNELDALIRADQQRELPETIAELGCRLIENRCRLYEKRIDCSVVDSQIRNSAALLLPALKENGILDNQRKFLENKGFIGVENFWLFNERFWDNIRAHNEVK